MTTVISYALPIAVSFVPLIGAVNVHRIAISYLLVSLVVLSITEILKPHNKSVKMRMTLSTVMVFKWMFVVIVTRKTVVAGTRFARKASWIAVRIKSAIVSRTKTVVTFAQT